MTLLPPPPPHHTQIILIYVAKGSKMRAICTIGLKLIQIFVFRLNFPVGISMPEIEKGYAEVTGRGES